MDHTLRSTNWSRRALRPRGLQGAWRGLRRHALVFSGWLLASASVLCTMLGIAAIVTRHDQGAGAFAAASAAQHALVLYALVGALALSGLLLAVSNHERRAALARLRVSIAQFRALAAQMNDGLVVIDSAGVITAVSERFASMLGYRSHELIGTRASTIGIDIDPAALPYARPQGGDCELQRAAGDTLAARVITRALAPVDGVPSGMLAVVTDLSEQRRVECARRQAEDRARAHLNQLAHVARVSSLGEMASAIAHEINQPLTAIASYARACMRRLQAAATPQPDVLEAMAKVADEALRAGEVVRHIRAFLQAREAEMAPIEPNRLVGEVLRLAQPEARQLGAVLQTELAAGLPQVIGEPIQLEQVILNLVRNGLEAMRDAGSSPRVVTLRTAMVDDTVEISVRDTGPGIDPAAAEQLFEPFYTTKSEGLGIGLAISRSIVAMHEGTLRAAAGSDGGAIFTIHLPRMHCHAQRID